MLDCEGVSLRRRLLFGIASPQTCDPAEDHNCVEQDHTQYHDTSEIPAAQCAVSSTSTFLWTPLVSPSSKLAYTASENSATAVTLPRLAVSRVLNAWPGARDAILTLDV